MITWDYIFNLQICQLIIFRKIIAKINLINTLGVRKMKKIVILIIIGLSILSLVACQSDAEIKRISRYFDLEHPQEILDGQFIQRFFMKILGGVHNRY